MKSKQSKKKLSLNVMLGHDKGLVLIAALALIAILAIVSTTAVITTTTDIKISGNYKTSVQAFYIAEAGIQDGIGRLMNGIISDSGAKTNPNWNNTTTYSSTGFNNSFTVTHQVLGGSVVTDDSGTPLFLINSTGTSSTSIKQIEAVVRLAYALPFTKALEGCDGVTISSNGFTDSYDSAKGSYASQVIPARKDNKNNEWARDKGNIGTTNAGADIIVDGDAQVHGNAKATRYVGVSGTGSPVSGLGTPANLTGYKGSPDTNIANAVIYGIPTESNSSTDCDPLDTTTLFNTARAIETSNNNAEIINLSSNYPYDTSRDFSLVSNDTFSLGSSGQTRNYHFRSFALNSSSGVTINGTVTFYVSGNFGIGSNTSLTLSNGSKLTVYVTGTLNISSNASNSIVNPGVPTNLMIYSSATSSSISDYKVNVSSSSNIVGTVYAPNAAIDISSNSDTMGAIKGKYINSPANAKFHYDEAMGRLEGYPVLGYKIISWREIN